MAKLTSPSAVKAKAKKKGSWRRPFDMHVRGEFVEGGRRVTLKDLTRIREANEALTRGMLTDLGYELEQIYSYGTYAYEEEI